MIGFLFLTYDNVFNENIWIEYFNGANNNEYKIFVHPKDKILIQNQAFFKDCIVPNVCKTSWGDFSLLEAQRILMENAVSIPEIKHMIFVSQNAIPTTSFRALYNFLENKNSFISYNLAKRSEHLSRYHTIKNPCFPKNKFLVQSQWCILSKNHAKTLLMDHAEIKKIFGTMRIPDEHVYVNYLKYFKNNDIEKKVTTYVEWSGETPKVFHKLSNDFITKIKNTGCFFMRKVGNNADIDVKYLLS